jgi:4-diphosphocytidyl-2-C-methyl-D-erythritol kinase
VRCVTAFAPAKINLALHVGPPRADGRHDLVSVVAFADVGDRVTIEDGAAAFRVEGPFAAQLTDEPENLVTRALALMHRARPARVTLEKNLPVASGIGGGSADAAAALRAARLYFSGTESDDELALLARALGSDVPACVFSRPAMMRCAGEDVTPFALADLHAVLVNPGAPLSTAAVYRRFDERGAFGALDLAPPAGGADRVVDALGRARNDLEAPACDLEPAVADVLAALRANPETRLARMSGSGATCFALVADAAAAAGLAARIADRRPRWWIRPARLGAIDAAARQV